MTKNRNLTETTARLALAVCMVLLLAQPVSAHLDRKIESRKSLFCADMKWKLYSFIDKYHKYFKLPFLKVENGTPDRFHRIEVKKNVAIPMRDDVRLFANIYKPKSDGRFPVILTRMPYGKDEYYCWMPAIGKFWARKGYVFVVQDVRGKFCSEGEFEPLINEIDDGYDTLEWIVKQPWCDGNIGMEGESYYGYTTWAAATTGHPNLKCISPMNTAMDFHASIFQNGAFTLQTAGTYPILMHGQTYQNVLRLDNRHLPLMTLDDNAGIPTPSYDKLLKHPFRDDVTEGYNLHNMYEQIQIPVLVLAGWYDVFLKTTIDDWARIRRENENTEHAGKQWLVVSPVDHESTTERTNRIGQLDIGDKSSKTRWEVKQAFFDRWLKGIANGFDKAPPVQIFVIGDNDWRYEQEWPPAGVQYVDYYFHSNGIAGTSDSDGTLDMEKPREEPHDDYVYDPTNPVDIACETDLWMLADQLKDRMTVEKRDDVLVYTTAELEKDMEITGPISVTLFAASSAVDTDYTAALVDVFPGGYIHLIQEGIQRASHRESATGPALIEPDRIYKYSIDLWATSYVIRAGHRMRVEISSSNFDRFARNLNTGKKFGTGAETVAARQKIYHTAEFPSHITLPLMPRPIQQTYRRKPNE